MLERLSEIRWIKTNHSIFDISVFINAQLRPAREAFSKSLFTLFN